MNLSDRICNHNALIATVAACFLLFPFRSQGEAQNSSPQLKQLPFRIQLWNPSHPVDIFTYNPEREQLQLPEPQTIPTLQEIYGSGYTEENLATRVRVGANITFAISYNDGASEGFFDPTLGAARQNAFEFALDIWSSLLQGPGVISVAASMTPRGGTGSSAVLASCGPASIHTGFANQPIANTWYPDALVEIISGSDPDPGVVEIAVDFNSDVDNAIVLGNTNWYYGTDGNPGVHIDFVHITLHEMCHGFGFSSSFTSSGTWGIGDGSGSVYPTIYDWFLVNSTGTQLITLPASPNLVTTNNVFWNGTIGLYSYQSDFAGSGYVPIFAPNPWKAGSSISHLDENTFSGAWTELITPSYTPPPVIHNPDVICLGILQDMGYSLANSRYVDLNNSGFEDGSSQHPYNTLTEGINNVPTGGHVRIYAGNYPGAMTITKNLFLHSCGGVAKIGTATLLSSGSEADSSRNEPSTTERK